MGTGIRINGSSREFSHGLQDARTRLGTRPGAADAGHRRWPERSPVHHASYTAVIMPVTACSPAGGRGTRTAYRGVMGRVILFLLVAFAVVMLVSLVISALHFLFWFAVVAVVILGALRLSQGLRRAR